MELFINDFSTVRIFHLKNNYRSDGQLLNALEKFYKRNSKDIIEVPQSIYNFSNNYLVISVEKSIIDEAFYIGKKIKEIILTEDKNIVSDDGKKFYLFRFCNFAEKCG